MDRAALCTGVAAGLGLGLALFYARRKSRRRRVSVRRCTELNRRLCERCLELAEDAVAAGNHPVKKDRFAHAAPPPHHSMPCFHVDRPMPPQFAAILYKTSTLEVVVECVNQVRAPCLTAAPELPEPPPTSPASATTQQQCLFTRTSPLRPCAPKVNQLHDLTAHAEIVAIREAGKKLGLQPGETLEVCRARLSRPIAVQDSGSRIAA